MIHITPQQLTLGEGRYEIAFPPTWENKGIVYKFWCWENGDTNPTRIINLTADMNVRAIYRPIPLERSVSQELKKVEFSIKKQMTKLQAEVRELKIEVREGHREVKKLFQSNQDELKQILLEIANQLEKKDPQKAKEAKKWHDKISFSADLVELFVFLTGVPSLPALVGTDIAKRVAEFLTQRMRST